MRVKESELQEQSVFAVVEFPMLKPDGETPNLLAEQLAHFINPIEKDTGIEIVDVVPDYDRDVNILITLEPTLTDYDYNKILEHTSWHSREERVNRRLIDYETLSHLVSMQTLMDEAEKEFFGEEGVTGTMFKNPEKFKRNILDLLVAAGEAKISKVEKVKKPQEHEEEDTEFFYPVYIVSRYEPRGKKITFKKGLTHIRELPMHYCDLVEDNKDKAIELAKDLHNQDGMIYIVEVIIDSIKKSDLKYGCDFNDGKIEQLEEKDKLSRINKKTVSETIFDTRNVIK